MEKELVKIREDIEMMQKNNRIELEIAQRECEAKNLELDKVDKMIRECIKVLNNKQQNK